jgi:hypothetical protein
VYVFDAPLDCPLFQNATTSRSPAAGARANETVIEAGAKSAPFVHCEMLGAAPAIGVGVGVGVALETGVGVALESGVGVALATGVGVPCAPPGASKIRAAKPVLLTDAVALSQMAAFDESASYSASACHVEVGPEPSVHGAGGFVHV